MKDPLQEIQGAELMEKIGQLLNNVPVSVVRDIAVSLLINSMRQTIAHRNEAEAAINEIFGRAKSILLMHYDSVTGVRKALFPYTQVISPPLHVEKTES
jgi:hypothetical protein